jgi:ABC-2 type transport system ATP-binding protein
MIAMNWAVETEGLTKRYIPASAWPGQRSQPVTAVSGINLAIPRGQRFGLLGPNGAGKTTLSKMLCTLILPSAGRATVAGYPLSQSGAIRAAVGLVVSDARSFYWRLSARRNLDFFAAMHGLHGRSARQRIDTVLRVVDLEAVADRRFSYFSSGMKQRLAIARSLLHRPQILFLDEPSRSLDPTARQRLHDLLHRLQAEWELTLFFITHDLAEAETMCDEVALLHQGRIRAQGSPARLRQQLRPIRHYQLQVSGGETAIFRQPPPTLPALHYQPGQPQASLSFQAGEDEGVVTAVLDYLRQHQVVIHQITSTPPTLAEVFHHFTRDG